MPQTKSFYYAVRDWDPVELRAVDRAARFLYLNRHSFNGVYRENKLGKFNVPRGTKTAGTPSLEEIRDAACKLRRVELASCDFQQVLGRVRRGDFVYMDPPYAIQRRRHRGEYGYGAFDVDDLDRLIDAAKLAHSKGARILISYADTEKLRRRFSAWRVESIAVNRSVSGFHERRRSVRELLIRNY
jgi:DNA adenine methylase